MSCTTLLAAGVRESAAAQALTPQAAQSVVTLSGLTSRGLDVAEPSRTMIWHCNIPPGCLSDWCVWITSKLTAASACDGMAWSHCLL